MPDEVREKMAFSFAQSMDEVLRLALLPAEPAPVADLPDAEAVPRVEQERPIVRKRPVPAESSK